MPAATRRRPPSPSAAMARVPRPTSGGHKQPASPRDGPRDAAPIEIDPAGEGSRGTAADTGTGETPGARRAPPSRRAGGRRAPRETESQPFPARSGRAWPPETQLNRSARQPALDCSQLADRAMSCTGACSVGCARARGRRGSGVRGSARSLLQRGAVSPPALALMRGAERGNRRDSLPYTVGGTHGAQTGR